MTMHKMNHISLRHAMNQMLAVVQNDFPGNTASDINSAVSNDELMACTEPGQLLRLLADKIDPSKAKAKPKATAGAD